MVYCFTHLSGLQLWQMPVGSSPNSSRQSREQHIYFHFGAGDNFLSDILKITKFTLTKLLLWFFFNYLYFYSQLLH